MIRIWKLADAPAHLKDLCPAGLKDTWVLEVPPDMRGEVEGMIEANKTSLREISIVELEDGTAIFFGLLPTDPGQGPAGKSKTGDPRASEAP